MRCLEVTPAGPTRFRAPVMACCRQSARHAAHLPHGKQRGRADDGFHPPDSPFHPLARGSRAVGLLSFSMTLYGASQSGSGRRSSWTLMSQVPVRAPQLTANPMMVRPASWSRTRTKTPGTMRSSPTGIVSLHPVPAMPSAPASRALAQAACTSGWRGPAGRQQKSPPTTDTAPAPTRQTEPFSSSTHSTVADGQPRRKTPRDGPPPPPSKRQSTWVDSAETGEAGRRMAPKSSATLRIKLLDTCMKTLRPLR